MEYQFGDKVTYTDKAYKAGMATKRQIAEGAIGIVTNEFIDVVDVIWKGNKTSSGYDKSFIMKIQS